MNNLLRFFALFSVLLCVFSCAEKQEKYVLQVPKGWPYPEIPSDKSLTHERVLLGRKLFYDPILSANQQIACATCHKPQFAFADTVAFSGSHEAEFKRNTPSLFNVAWFPYFFAEGGVPNLELVSVSPIQSKAEMGFNIGEAVLRLSANKEYMHLFQKAYDTLPSTYTLVRALGAFQRTLISGNSPYDRYRQGDSVAISSLAKRGMQLFFSDRLNCGSCHTGFLFTDFGFYNVGLSAQADVGRYRVTLQPTDSGTFKTPSLRNIALTAPYMHDGSLNDLGAVVDFYERGGGNDAHKSEKIKPFHLTANDKAALVAFLKSLTDTSALNNSDFLPLKK